MAVYFKDLDTTRDWRAVVENLALAGLSVERFDLADAYRSIREAATGSRPDPSTDERAGVWLRTTASAALLTLLNDPRFGGPLDRDPDRKAAAKAFVADALSLKDLNHFDPAHLPNPAELPALRVLREALPTFLRDTTDSLALNEVEIDRRFAALLRSVAARAYALDPGFYAPLAAALSGPFRTGYDRDLAWAAHANWIAGRMQEPIFFPDAGAKADIPLAAVYHRLRCWWDADRPTDPDAPPGPRVVQVADLHRTLRAWLDAPDRRAPIRVVAGGPGCGKSSFARAFAGGDALAAGWRVVFVELQHMALRGGLDAALGAYLVTRNKRGGRGQGFDENPLDWRASDPDTPILLVFDGLDELSRAENEARDLSRRFIAELRSLLSSLNGSGAPVRALVLGRSAACAAALEEANLPASTLLHVAPLTPLEASSFGSGNALRDLELQIRDPHGLCERDEREQFWRRYARVHGEPEEPAPDAITANALGDLTAEVLLLHLLIVSGYAGPGWADAAENRNRVYEPIFDKVYQRDRLKEHTAARRLDRAEYLALLECLGLAAWRDNLRTGSEADFRNVRDIHSSAKQRNRFEKLPEAELENVALLFYTRPDLEGRGFEFIHKSFGEYLAARGLLAAGLRAAKLMTEGDEPRSVPEIAQRWTKLIAQAALTDEIHHFLVDEARLRDPKSVEDAIAPLAEVLSWAFFFGMPAHEVFSGLFWSDCENRQRCAQSALLAVIDALNRTRRSPGSKPGATVAVDLSWDRFGILPFLHRLGATTGSGVRLALGCLNLSGADLGRADLSRTNLNGAYLSGADLSGANLTLAQLSGANLSGANLNGANLTVAQLSEADLNGAYMIGANLNVTDLNVTDLSGAHLIGANLSGANLMGADLIGADLSGANLSGANLQSAYLRDWTCASTSLRSADFRRSKNLCAEDVELAFGVRSGYGRTLLPEGMEPPAHWHVAEDAEQDSHEAQARYEAALAGFRATLERG